MRFEGHLWKAEKHWLAEIPALDAITQGRTKKEALSMLKDWVRSALDKPDFEVDVRLLHGEHVELAASDTGAIVALMLRRQREKSGLSLADVAQRLHVKSRNAYARYEQGAAIPTIAKLVELLSVVKPRGDLILGVAEDFHTPQSKSSPTPLR